MGMADQGHLDSEIAITRESVKQKTAELAKLEPELASSKCLKGMDLKALSEADFEELKLR